MTAHLLAAQLRQRQRGYHPRAVLGRLSDEDVIDCYLVCSGCGARWMSLADALRLAAAATTAAEWIAAVSPQHRH